MRPLLLFILTLAVSSLRAAEHKTQAPKPNSKSSQATSTQDSVSPTPKPDATKKPRQQRQTQLPDKHQIDADVARVKQQMQDIQKSSTPKDRKIEMQRSLLQREIARGEALKREIQGGASQDNSAPARDRRKASLDYIQKFLDIVRSMNPQI
jgi:hypothetical protein